MELVKFILKNSTEFAAALEAVKYGYSFSNQPNGLILFTCFECDAAAVRANLERVTPLYCYQA